MTYQEWKDKYPDDLIMCAEMSSVHVVFYCAYGEDAKILHQILGYRLHYNKQGIERCGGPNYQSMGLKLKMANKSYKVVTCARVLESWNAEEEVQRVTINIEDYPQKIGAVLHYMEENRIAWRVFEHNYIEENEDMCERKGIIPFSAPLADSVPQRPCVQVGNHVQLVNSTDGEILDIFLEQTVFSYEYIGAGGPYEEAKTRRKEISNAGDFLEDGSVVISTESFLGKAIIGKEEGEKVNFINPVGKKCEYTIIKIV